MQMIKNALDSARSGKGNESDGRSPERRSVGLQYGEKENI
jgi:hypothetical protein